MKPKVVEFFYKKICYVYFYFAELLWEIGNQIVIPSMLHLDTTAIHMAKCVTRAYNIDYHLSVYTHCYSKFKDFAHNKNLKK